MQPSYPGRFSQVHLGRTLEPGHFGRSGGYIGSIFLTQPCSCYRGSWSPQNKSVPSHNRYERAASRPSSPCCIYLHSWFDSVHLETALKVCRVRAAQREDSGREGERGRRIACPSREPGRQPAMFLLRRLPWLISNPGVFFAPTGTNCCLFSSMDRSCFSRLIESARLSSAKARSSCLQPPEGLILTLVSN